MYSFQVVLRERIGRTRVNITFLVIIVRIKSIPMSGSSSSTINIGIAIHHNSLAKESLGESARLDIHDENIVSALYHVPELALLTIAGTIGVELELVGEVISFTTTP